jgi:hypothetical protein
MVRPTILTVAGLLASASLVGAQPIPAGMKVGLAMYLQAGYNGLKQELLEAAEEMPADAYGFRPGAAAEMRTYGQVLLHVAETQLATCSSLKGTPNPREGKNLERDLTTKADVMKALSESFAACDQVLANLTDDTTAQFVKVGQGEVVRSAVSFLRQPGTRHALLEANRGRAQGRATRGGEGRDGVPGQT